MSKPSLILSLVVVFCGVSNSTNSIEKDWDYTLEGVSSNSTDESIITTNLRPLRVTPTEYGFNGTAIITEMINEQYVVEIKIYRSATGSNQYHLTPYEVEETPMLNFMNVNYKSLLMNSLKDCSNLPVFDIFEGPFTGEYYLKSCVIQTNEWPAHMQPGFYKIVTRIEGPLVKFRLETVVKIYSKPLGNPRYE